MTLTNDEIETYKNINRRADSALKRATDALEKFKGNLATTTNICNTMSWSESAFEAAAWMEVMTRVKVGASWYFDDTQLTQEMMLEDFKGTRTEMFKQWVNSQLLQAVTDSTNHSTMSTSNLMREMVTMVWGKVAAHPTGDFIW